MWLFLAVQNSSIGDLVTHSLTDWGYLLLLRYKERLLTFETFDQSDEETWPDQEKDNDKDNYKDRDNDKDKYI